MYFDVKTRGLTLLQEIYMIKPIVIITPKPVSLTENENFNARSLGGETCKNDDL